MPIFSITQIITCTMTVEAEDDEAAQEWWNNHPEQIAEQESELEVEELEDVT